MIKHIRILTAAAFLLAVFGCGKSGLDTARFPGTKEGARALIGEFMKPGADLKKLTAELRPTKEDYKAFYADQATADRAEIFFDKLWNSGDAVVAPKEGQSEVQLYSATVDELKNDAGEASEFPTGLRALAATDNLKGGQTIYAFKFVKPGESMGMAFEGLTHINGRWRLFPKAWRFMEAK